MTPSTSNRFGRISSAFLRINGYLRTILTSESSNDPRPHVYYLARLRTDRCIQRPDGAFVQRDGQIEFKFDKPFEALELRTLFRVYLYCFRKPNDHQLSSYKGLILAPTGSAHSEYKSVGVFKEPGQEENYLEKAKFVTSGDEIQDTSKPINGWQLVTIV